MPPSRNRSKRSNPAEAYCSYFFKIERLSSHYGLSTSTEREQTEFVEYVHPEIEATCLSPSRFKDRLTSFTIMGDRQMEEDLRKQTATERESMGIGTLTMRGRQSSYLGRVPYDVAWSIQPLISSGVFRFIHLHGAAMLRGAARIKWLAFNTEIDPEDL